VSDVGGGLNNEALGELASVSGGYKQIKFNTQYGIYP